MKRQVFIIRARVIGTPYCKCKRRGNVAGLKSWIKDVRAQTKNLPKVPRACYMKIDFLLPPDKFPKDCPYGPDVDNLLKLTFDALNRTIFRDVPGHDSCVQLVRVKKEKSNRPPGMVFTVMLLGK